VLDDLQWADAGSVGLLFHLGRRLRNSRILIIGLYRSTDVALGWNGERHHLEPVVNELRRGFGDIQIDLNQVGGRAFVDALINCEPNSLDEAFRQTLTRCTGGHALFTVELLRDLRECGNLVQDEVGRWMVGPTLNWERLPARVEAVIAERIGRLPERWQAMLAVASVEGETFTAEVLARVWNADEDEVIQHLSGPLSKQHGLVSAWSFGRLGEQHISRYRFRHHLFQRYLYNSLDEVERVRLHGAIKIETDALYRENATSISLLDL
jgi:predicted ATPase